MGAAGLGDDPEQPGQRAWELGGAGERESGTMRLEEARRAFLLAWEVYRVARVDRYDAWFETRLRSIDDLIASRRSGLLRTAIQKLLGR